jgi:putative transposase
MSVRTRNLKAIHAEAIQVEIKELDVETAGEEQASAQPALPAPALRCRLEPLLEGAGLARSTFYRRTPAAVPSGEATTGKAPQKKRGRHPKTWIATDDGAAKSTGEVLETIEEILSGEFVIYGYAKVQKELCKRCIAIGRKKTYSLMKSHALLTGARRARPETKRQFVRVRTVKAERPFEHLQMDIKQIYLQSEDRLAFVLTLEDTFSRAAIAQTVKYSMLSNDSVALLKDAQIVWKSSAAR